MIRFTQANGALAALLLFAPCFAATPAAPSSAAGAKDTWQEETLLQLSELRKSQGELKQEVAELRAEVARLHTANAGTVRDRSALDLRSPQFPSVGDPKAQIAIVEFSDFQCPYCRKHEQATLPALNAKYLSTGKARYFFVDFPLSFHAQAVEAAVAGACAHQQGAFWKMHDLLFENQNKLAPALYPQLAGTLQLDKDKFESCLKDSKIKQQIDSHAALGDTVGVQGTPAFVIGRLKDGMLTDTRALSGAQPFETFEKVIEKYIAGS
jgi:protein-disulfide isomerase